MWRKGWYCDYFSPYCKIDRSINTPQFSFSNLGLQIFLTLWETNLLYLRIIFHLKFLFFQWKMLRKRKWWMYSTMPRVSHPLRDQTATVQWNVSPRNANQNESYRKTFLVSLSQVFVASRVGEPHSPRYLRKNPLVVIIYQTWGSTKIYIPFADNDELW